MSFNHEIVPKDATLEGVSYATPNGASINAPTLSADLVNKGEDAHLTWTEPTSNVTIYSYKIYIDGVEVAEVRDLEYTQTSLTYNQQYNYQVRAIGPLGILGPMSNQVTLTGGGLPSPILNTLGEYKGGSITWDDLSSNSFYTIEGYNVYYATGHNEGSASWTKLNSTLLSTTVYSYALFGLADSFDFMLAVTFEYDGGQESPKYIGKATTISANPYYMVEIDGAAHFIASNEFQLGYYYGGDFIYKGLQVAENLSQEIIVSEAGRSSLIQRVIWTKEWLGVYFNDLTDVVFHLNSPNHLQEAKFTMAEGCASDAWNYVEGNITSIRVHDLAWDEHVRAGWWHYPRHTIYGPTCDGETNLVFRIDIAPEDIVKEWNLGNSYGFKFQKKLPSDDRLKITIDPNDPSIAIFEIKHYKGLPYQNIYIKPSGGSYSKHNASPLQIPITYYEVNDLTAGDYTGQVEYLFDDQSAYSTKSNEVNFTIS